MFFCEVSRNTWDMKGQFSAGRYMSGIQKETSQRPRNINQYLYVKSTGPGCWGTCPTVIQSGEWLSGKISGVALWTSSVRISWHRRPRWIVCPSEPFLGDLKWRNHRESGLDFMEGDRELPTWISASLVTCTRDPLAAGSELPRSCRNHSLLHTQRYCHRFAHSRLQIVSFWTPPAHFFFNAPYTSENQLV